MLFSARQLAAIAPTLLSAFIGTGCVADAPHPSKAVLDAIRSAKPSTAPTRPSGFAGAPFMGWTTWNLEDVHRKEYTITWMNAASTRAQADIMHKVLQPYGYTYINVDSGWCGGFDNYGRPITDLKRYPGGMAALAKYVHHYGQKLGIYWIPGIQHSQYDANPPIYGTHYHIRDIVARPFRAANAFGDWHMKIDFTKPGAQEYIDSVVKLWASWGIDYLKIDGVGPGSDSEIDSRPDIAAYHKAIAKCGRPIWLELSWRLDPRYASFWEKYSNGRRVNDDVDSLTSHISGWSQVLLRFVEAPQWTEAAGPTKGWNDFDTAPIGDGELDGLTDDERRTVMTFWSIECAPLLIGDDLFKLDKFGIEILTNPEVIAIDQAGRPAVQMAGGDRQVWRVDNGDGTITIGLFNLNDKTASVSADLGYLGYSGPQPIRDLWCHKNLGTFSGSFSAVLAPHACRLVRIGTPGSRRKSPGANTRTAAFERESTVIPAAVSGLRTNAGSTSIKLSWTPTTGASRYVVWRSTSMQAGYRALASDIRTAHYEDRTVVDGTPYFYQVTAVGPGGESARSAPATAVPGRSNVISVDFCGSSVPMDVDETAGAVPAIHWNIGSARTGDLALIDGAGNASGASLTYFAGGSYTMSTADQPGNIRMMRSYLETYGHDTSTVKVVSLPAEFTRNGYDVYVYCDGGNGNSTRSGRYTIGASTILATDTPGSDFHGAFSGLTSTGEVVNASKGVNFVEFKNLKDSSFTLLATPVSSTDEYLRAPINGIQIVAHDRN